MKARPAYLTKFVFIAGIKTLLNTVCMSMIIVLNHDDLFCINIHSFLFSLKMNFATMQYAKLMHTSYKSYGGSALDSRNKRFFTVANTPYYDSFNYSINVMEYSSSKEYLTLPFKGYSIGGIVYDPVLQKLFGFVQTPAGVEEKVKYKTFLAQIQLDRGELLLNFAITGLKKVLLH